MHLGADETEPALGILPQRIDRAQPTFAFEVPERPAIAGLSALDECADLVNRTLAPVAGDRAVRLDLGAERTPAAEQNAARRDHAKLHDGTERHARLGPLRTCRDERGWRQGNNSSQALAGRRKDALDQAKEIIAKVAHTKIVPISADVSRAEDCARAFAEGAKALGQIDVLVNNAGTSQRGDFETVTDAVWQADLDLKLFAAIRLARAALPGMKARKWGRIINILNTGAKAPKASSAPTSVTRAAGMALTKVLANEGAPHNVLVNALLVGLIESEQHEKKVGGNTQKLAELYDQMGKGVPLGRVGKAEEFANMALFLASDAGSYITGTAINIDGGTSPVV